MRWAALVHLRPRRIRCRHASGGAIERACTRTAHV